MDVLVLISVGIAIHLVFLKSVFDIYFTSPLVHGMTNQPINGTPPAKRLVLISCDGLRADKFYENDPDGTPWMPFLRAIADQRGISGVSHTRVPTESRPGHVAMIAGFYEDVSAVTKGWKENPVEFDSVFNQSRWTWGWGSPDIVPIFTKIRRSSGELTEIPHIFADTYASAFEDFAASPVDLDYWVVDRVTEFLIGAKHNSTLMGMLNDDRIIFFLHLLGMDTTGHVSKPQSRIYTDNMRLVDAKIAAAVNLLDEFYGRDEQTAFLFTSDHGMTDWGSHGSGQTDETATPVVAWGAGLTSLRRHGTVSDMEQAALAPLMSSLIGIPIPANSVGVLPLQYLNTSAAYRTTAFLTSTLQMYEQIRVLQHLKRSESFDWMFKPFPNLDEAVFLKIVTELKNRTSQSEAAVNSDINELVSLCLKALDYYQKYDRHFLQFLVVQGYAGWIVFLAAILLKNASQVDFRQTSAEKKAKLHITQTGIATACLTAFVLLVQGSPKIHILYALLPVATWTAALTQITTLVKPIYSRLNKDNKLLLSFIGSTATFIIAVELIVLTFFYRSAVSVGLVFGGCWMFYSARGKTWIKTGFLATSALLAVFPLLPVVGKSRQISLVLLTGVVAIIGVRLIIWKFQTTVYRRTALLSTQSLLLACSIVIVYLTDRKVDARLSPGLIIHAGSWGSLGLNVVIPFFGSTHIIFRFLNVGCGLLTSYLLMSVAYESVFFLILTIHLYLWIELEAQDSLQSVSLGMMSIFDSLSRNIYTETRLLNLSDFRRAFFFVFLIMTSFFGTGNIASVNSFDPASAFCFVTVFRPFVMGAILLCKVMLPFLLIGCAFHVIHVACRVPMRSMCLVVMLISDFMALHFFFLVKTEGSWLDIGTSISHYVMVMALIVFTSVLSYLSSILMSKTISWWPFLR